LFAWIQEYDGERCIFAPGDLRIDQAFHESAEPAKVNSLGDGNDLLHIRL